MTSRTVCPGWPPSFLFPHTTRGTLKIENSEEAWKVKNTVKGGEGDAKKQLCERHPAAQATSGIGGTAAEEQRHRKRKHDESTWLLQTTCGSQGVATLGIASLGQHFLKRQKKRREEEVEGGTKEGKTSRKREDKGRAGQYVQAGSELEKSQIRGVQSREERTRSTK